MSLLRIPFILSGTWAAHVASASRPNPPPEKAEQIKRTGSEHFMAVIVWCGPVIGKVRRSFFLCTILDILNRRLIQICFWGLTSVEIAVIIASVDPSSPLSTWIFSTLVVNNSPTTASKIRFTPLFLVGWLLVLSGSLIRLACYRALGKLFTFELSIRKNHKLITSGPYAIVRHPAYTGLFMIMLGYSLWQLGGGSWLRECSGLSLDGTLGRGLLFTSVTTDLFVVLALVSRTYREDAMLREEFSDWDRWAERVPCKLIPYVY